MLRDDQPVVGTTGGRGRPIGTYAKPRLPTRGRLPPVRDRLFLDQTPAPAIPPEHRIRWPATRTLGCQPMSHLAPGGSVLRWEPPATFVVPGGGP